jgi:hypothetical protein
MEQTGVPIDVPMLRLLREHWRGIQDGLIEEVDRDFSVYDGRCFRAERFGRYLTANGIPWPRLANGDLALDDDTWRQQANSHPEIAPLRELRHSLSELRPTQLQVGNDGRNRALLSPFRSKTGRNQPSNTEFIFGPSVWLRGLIRPPPGRAIAYLDWRSQEIAIAAALSGDEHLWNAYASGDPYLAFAKQTGLAPDWATKDSHGAVRNRCKAIVLGVLYGMSAEGLATRAGIPTVEARDLLRRHKETYRTFWRWAEQNVNAALLGVPLCTRFGWPIRIGHGAKVNARSILNWPMQANGAEMMRLACSIATEAGLMICAPIHDALLLEARVDEIDEQVRRLTAIMKEASAFVLGDGRICGVDAKIVRYPDRYSDERGKVMWSRVMTLIAGAEEQRSGGVLAA